MNVLRRACVQDVNFSTQRASCLFDVLQLRLEWCIAWVQQYPHQSSCRNQLVQEFETLTFHLADKKINARRIAIGSVETGDQPQLDRVVAAGEHDRNGCGRRFGCERGPDASCRSDDIDSTPNQVTGERRQPIVLTLSPAIFHRHVLPFGVPAILQSLMECCECIGGLARRSAAEKPDHRDRRLLRVRRERPRRSRAAEQRDELAPPQPIEMHPLPLQGRQGSGLGGVKSGGACARTKRRLVRWSIARTQRSSTPVQPAL